MCFSHDGLGCQKAITLSVSSILLTGSSLLNLLKTSPTKKSPIELLEKEKAFLETLSLVEIIFYPAFPFVPSSYLNSLPIPSPL